MTPIYNSEKFLAETIESAISQTHQNWELLLVFDQATKDRSLQIAQDYAAKDPRIKILEFKNEHRVSGARNYAIDAATGEWLAFLDSDDLWLPNKLEQQLSFCQKHQVRFCCSNYIRIDTQGKPISEAITAPAKVNYQRLLGNNSIACLTAFIERKLLGQIRFVDHHQEDFIFWLEILKTGVICHTVPEVLAKYRMVPTSRSSTVFRPSVRWKIYRQREQLGFFQSLYLMFDYGLSAILKRL